MDGTPSMSEKTHVLVVEDNELDRQLLGAHLSHIDAETDFARDGLEAWELLVERADRYDVVLLDRTMPRMNGLELLAKMKADARCRTLPVILQTACVGREEMIEGIRAGAYYYLTKPYDVDVLTNVIRTAAADRSATRRLQSQLERGIRSLAILQHATFTLRTIDEARNLGTVLAMACPDPDSAVVGLTELLINAVEHGNLAISYDEKTVLHASGQWESEISRRLTMPQYAARFAEVTFERVNGEIRFTIRDAGNGFDWRQYWDIDPRRAFDTHGRGILMARHLTFSNLEYRGCGNEVVAVVRNG